MSLGDKVNAGDRLANVGCNGDSSSPHLHLGYYQFDNWGHLRMLPIGFAFADGAGGTVAGVAQSELNLAQAPPPAADPTGPGAEGLLQRAEGAAHELVEGGIKAIRTLLDR